MFMILSRCEVEDEGISVSRSLGVKVLVEEKPQIEIFPSAVVLSKDRRAKAAGHTESTIFCFTKGKKDPIVKIYACVKVCLFMFLGV